MQYDGAMVGPSAARSHHHQSTHDPAGRLSGSSTLAAKCGDACRVALATTDGMPGWEGTVGILTVLTDIELCQTLARS